MIDFWTRETRAEMTYWLPESLCKFLLMKLKHSHSLPAGVSTSSTNSSDGGSALFLLSLKMVAREFLAVC